MAKIRKSKKKDEATIIQSIVVTYFCGYLEKDFTKEISIHDISSWEADCDLCGSHGAVDYKISQCECGHYHTININSW